jgi:hypothetical protein
MKSIDRLYQYLEYKGIKPTNFEKAIGFSSGYLSGQKKRRSDFGESILRSIIEYCQDIDEIWLLTGKGSMIKNNNESKNASSNNSSIESREEIPILKEQIIKLQTDNITKSEKIIDLMNEINNLKNEIQILKK